MHLHFNKIRTDVVAIVAAICRLRVHIPVPLLRAAWDACGRHEEELDIWIELSGRNDNCNHWSIFFSGVFVSRMLYDLRLIVFCLGQFN